MNKGFGIIEVILSVAIVAILCVSFTALTFQSLRVARVNAAELKARMYVQEIMEAVIDLEQSDWDELSACVVCHPVIQDGKWAIESGQENIDIYTRYLTIDNGSSKKKVEAHINWPDNDLTIESYVYKYE